MADATVRLVVDAVRRHLRREQGRGAVRHAAWLSAATVLLAGTLHLAVLSVPVDVVLWVVAGEWAALLAALAWRRPADAECALWIDRHLGGASAFTTLLESASQSQTSVQAEALRWLERWATAKGPDVLRSLAERRSAVRVSRSLLAMTVWSALALFVLTLPETAPTLHRQPNAPARPSSGDMATASVETPVTAHLASAIANALRSTDSPSEAESRRGGAAPSAGTAPSAGAARADDGSASTAPLSPATLPADALPTSDSRSPAALESGAGAGRSAGSGSGRDAGDSPDVRGDAAVSRAPTGTIAAVRSGATLGLAAGERRADMEQGAGFDESGATSASARPRAALAAAPATPPPAIATTRLSAAETSYVEAWMKATGRSR